MKLCLYQTEFRLAWWKYGSQPDLNPNTNSGGLYRNQYVYTAQPTPVPIPTQPVRNLFRTVDYQITSVPDTPLPSFPTSTTEQFTATRQRTYPSYQIPTSIPKTDSTSVPKTPLPTFSRPRTSTSYTTNPDPTNDPTNNPTTVPKTPLPTFPRTESTRRSTRRPVTTSSVRTTTTRRKELKRFQYITPLESKKYDCKWFGKYDCKYKKQYIKLLQDVQGNCEK